MRADRLLLLVLGYLALHKDVEVSVQSNTPPWGDDYIYKSWWVTPIGVLKIDTSHISSMSLSTYRKEIKYKQGIISAKGKEIVHNWKKHSSKQMEPIQNALIRVYNE